MGCGTLVMYSTSRKITVPSGKPSAVVRWMASSASSAPCVPSTNAAEHCAPGFATGAVDFLAIARTRVFCLDRFDAAARFDFVDALALFEELDAGARL